MKPLDRLKQQYRIFLTVDNNHKNRAANVYSSMHRL